MIGKDSTLIILGENSLLDIEENRISEKVEAEWQSSICQSWKTNALVFQQTITIQKRKFGKVR